MNIFAFGGGEIRLQETMPIDRQIVLETGRERPHALFVPTASADSADYSSAFRRIYGNILGCDIQIAELVRSRPSFEELREKLEWADLVYVGGGNTLSMLQIWAECGFSTLLSDYSKKNKIVCGISAGANCWFRYANSRQKILEVGSDIPQTICVEGLGLVEAAFCPHLRREPFRMPQFVNMLKGLPVVGLAVEDGCALQIVDGQYRILTAQENATVHRVYWHGGVSHRQRVTQDSGPLAELIRLPGRMPPQQSHCEPAPSLG